MPGLRRSPLTPEEGMGDGHVPRRLALDRLKAVGFFDMPLIQAAGALGIAVATLKLACRAQNLARWPYRERMQRRSLHTLLDRNLHVMADNHQPPQEVAAARGRQTRQNTHITEQFLRDHGYFDMPMLEAARALRIGLTTLKGICRGLGINRWPYRQRRLARSVRDALATLDHQPSRDAAREEGGHGERDDVAHPAGPIGANNDSGSDISIPDSK